VADLIDALLRAGDASTPTGRVFFAADNAAVTWQDIYAGIARAAGSNPLELQLPAPALALAGQAGNLLSLLTGRHFLMNSNKIALSRPRWWLCDSSRAQRELGWTATTQLDDGLRVTYEWYLEAGWLRTPRHRVGTAAVQEKTL
jgi:nucleoside-diphosphate-sugar epimerase